MSHGFMICRLVSRSFHCAVSIGICMPWPNDAATEAMCHINVVNATFKFSVYNILK